MLGVSLLRYTTDERAGYRHRTFLVPLTFKPEVEFEKGDLEIG